MTRRESEAEPATATMSAALSGVSDGAGRAPATRVAAGPRPLAVAAAPLSRGQRDPARYDVGGEHGRGGLGRVLRAEDRDLGRAVAIKELLRRDPIGEVRFFREAMITARLEHPGIVPVHEAGRWPDGTPFYTMKLVEGRPLRALIEAAADRRGRLALLPHVAAVADAMAYAHGKRIIHRDLKPSNVLVGSFGETVVIDWGLAKDVSREEEEELEASGPFRRSGGGDLTAAGAILGTPAYMAPEQARGEAADERADVYAIGAILYDVLAGRPPYGGSQQDVLKAVLRAAPAPIEEVDPQVPADLAAIVRRAMARDAAGRYRTAKGLADDLKRYLTGQLVSAHRYGARQLLRRWAARYRAALAVAAVAAIALAVGGALAVRQIIAERDQARRERGLAEARADALTLAEARRLVDEDPTASLAMLSGYPDNGAGWDDVARIAAEAVSRGVARLVLPTGDRTACRVAYSADGAYLAAAGAQSLRVWRTSDGVLVVDQRFPAATEEAAPSYLVAAAGRPRFVSVHLDGEVRIADAADGTARRMRAGVQLDDVVIGADGSWIAAAAADGTLRRWGLADGSERVIRAHAGEVYELVASADGAWLLSIGGDGRALLWDGALTGEAPRQELVAPGASLRAAALSADGSLAAASDERGAIWVWWRDGRQLRLAGDGKRANQLAFTRDGRGGGDGAALTLTASYADDLVRVWDLASGTATVRPGGRQLAIGADGWEVTGSSDGVVMLREPRSGWSRSLHGHRILIDWVALSADGDVASIGHDGVVRVWSHRLRPDGLFVHPSKVNAVRFFADGLRLAAATAAGELRMWDLGDGSYRARPGHAGGDVLRVFAADGTVAGGLGDGALRVARGGAGAAGEVVSEIAAIGGPVRAIATAADGAELFVGTAEGALLRVDVAAGRSELLRRYPGPVVAVVLDGAGDDGGRWLAIGAEDGSLDLYDRIARRFGPHRQLDGLRGATLLRDGTLAALDGAHTLHWWPPDGATAPAPARVPRGWRLIAGADGRELVSLSNDGAVRRWDGARQLSGILDSGPGHADAALSERAGLLAAGGTSGALRLLDLASGIATALPVGTAIRDVDLSADGRRVAAASGENIFVWRLDRDRQPPAARRDLLPWLRAHAQPTALTKGPLP